MPEVLINMGLIFANVNGKPNQIALFLFELLGLRQPFRNLTFHLVFFFFLIFSIFFRIASDLIDVPPGINQCPVI